MEIKTASIYQDLAYHKDKPLIQVLFETSFTKEVRIVMQEGTVMREHKTPHPIVVELLEGEIDFGVQGETRHLVKGDLIALGPRIPHDLKANKNSIIRLTLSKLDKAARVENVASQ